MRLIPKQKPRRIRRKGGILEITELRVTLLVSVLLLGAMVRH